MSGEAFIVVFRAVEGGVEKMTTWSARDVRDFTDRIIDKAFDAGLKCDPNFALGFVAAVDAAANGTIDIFRPLDTVNAAWADVNDITGRPCAVTSCMSVYCEDVRQ